ncbi:hypothetical protein ABD70_04270 [Alkalihalobacillus lehensis]|nr:hypothetical protein [Shouchella lehensis]
MTLVHAIITCKRTPVRVNSFSIMYVLSTMTGSVECKRVETSRKLVGRKNPKLEADIIKVILFSVSSLDMIKIQN